MSIEHDFVPAAQVHFSECVVQARTLNATQGHLAIYQETLDQIRQENTFPGLQGRSEKLVTACHGLERSQEQKAITISDLRRGAVGVSIQHHKLMAAIASKTGTRFHSAPQKGLLRVCEKLALAPEWKPERAQDIVRGAIESPNFSVMMNVLRLLCDLDAKLQTTGETGGIAEEMCITRSKSRFGQPTSGGWGDIMINFYFKDDVSWLHICEVQLVHTELYSVRKNMGAHGTYNVFRAALGLCEKLGEDPEEGADARVLGALVWKPGQQGPTGAGSTHQHPDAAVVSKVVSNQGKLMAILDAQVGRMAALEAQNERIIAQNEKIFAHIERTAARNEICFAARQFLPSE